VLVRDALAQFHAGRETVSADARFIWVSLGWLRLPVPNPGHLTAHDLHHVALGAAPDVAGEVQVGVFELRTGCANWLIFLLDVAALLVGLLSRPRQVLHWWRRYAGCGSLYGRSDLTSLLRWDVDALRAQLGADARSSLGRRARRRR
jgi:hypothetical protein